MSGPIWIVSFLIAVSTVASASDLNPELSKSKPDQSSQEFQEQRMREWIDRATGLHPGCKYASDIPMPPPPGKVALTFDDGPDPKNNAFVLQILRKHRIRAAFFMIGKEASLYPQYIQAVKSAGHLIGSHSWDHTSFHTLSVAKQAKEVTDAERILGPAMTEFPLFRYPFGNSSCETNKFLKSRGYKYVGWHIDSCDWAFNKTGAVSHANAVICGVKASNVKNYAAHVVDSIREKGGGIVLMHEIQPNTLKQLDQIIDHLERLGFTFVTLDDPVIQPDLW